MKTQKALLKLLYSDSNAFVVEVQPIIEFTVKRFIRDYCGKCMYDDLLQHINAELLEKKLEIIKRNYDRRFKLTTYLTQIVLNICFSYQKKFLSHSDIPLEDIQEQPVQKNDTDDKLAINRELYRLKNILHLFGPKRKKIEICLKVVFSIPFNEADFTEFFPDMNRETCQSLVDNINRNGKTDLQVFELLIPFFNKKESKENTTDSLRRWTNLKMNEIIKYLNHSQYPKNFNKETFGILIDYYFGMSQ